jgi:hypothetical protein
VKQVLKTKLDLLSKCKTCGKNAESDYCFQHKPRKPMKTSMMKKSFTTTKVVDDSYIKQVSMFREIWRKRKHYSEISGEYLGSEALSIYFHHILAKEKYPEACLDPENIVLLSLDEHTNVESNMYRYEEINKRRETLKTKYNI